MKSYNHLWEQFISDENIELAINNASKGKRERKSVKKRLENPRFRAEIKYYANHFKNMNPSKYMTESNARKERL